MVLGTLRDGFDIEIDSVRNGNDLPRMNRVKLLLDSD